VAPLSLSVTIPPAMSKLLLALLAVLSPFAIAADVPPPVPVNLWPAAAPGEKGDVGPETDINKPTDKLIAGRKIIKLANVSVPTIQVYKPAPDKDTGAAVIVCPGGGYGILALDLEGSEICQWLADTGVTGVLLKYRVPARKGEPRGAAPLQDAQRAIGLVRSKAAELKIDPKRIGILGFSAGGHLAAAASTNYEKRTYEPVDDADKISCRPDFSVLIYPAYLAAPKTDPSNPKARLYDVTQLAKELVVTKDTPPAFCVMTNDDGIGVENVYAWSLALKAQKVPCEVHTYPVGGHGYGLRPVPGQLVTEWPARCAEWMKAQGYLKK